MVRVVNIPAARAVELIRPVGTADPDLAWTPDGQLLMVDKDLLYSWRKGRADWKRVADLSAMGAERCEPARNQPEGRRDCCGDRGILSLAMEQARGVLGGTLCVVARTARSVRAVSSPGPNRGPRF